MFDTIADSQNIRAPNLKTQLLCRQTRLRGITMHGEPLAITGKVCWQSSTRCRPASHVMVYGTPLYVYAAEKQLLSDEETAAVNVRSLDSSENV